MLTPRVNVEYREANEQTEKITNVCRSGSGSGSQERATIKGMHKDAFQVCAELCRWLDSVSAHTQSCHDSSCLSLSELSGRQHEPHIAGRQLLAM